MNFFLLQASVALIKSRKATDAKLDYSHITVKFEVWVWIHLFYVYLGISFYGFIFLKNPSQTQLICCLNPGIAFLGQLQVELQTLDGLVKDRTQCAPNGYYFIPVYDKV